MRNTMNKKIHCITEGAIIVAFAFVLEIVCHWLNDIMLIEAFGGTITVCMVPIVYYSYRRGAAWGLFAGFTYSMLQMLLCISHTLPPAKTFGAVAFCILLDYFLAFTALGLADIFAKPFAKHRLWGYCIGAVAVCIIRFLFSFISGIVLWGAYVPEGMSVWIYSLVYNGAYMLPNTVLTGMLIVIVCAAFEPKTLRPMKKH